MPEVLLHVVAAKCVVFVPTATFSLSLLVTVIDAKNVAIKNLSSSEKNGDQPDVDVRFKHSRREHEGEGYYA
jgi:hypothetical protein